MGKRTIRLWERIKCPSCSGDGIVQKIIHDKIKYVTCEYCGGLGSVNVKKKENIKCPYCGKEVAITLLGIIWKHNNHDNKYCRASGVTHWDANWRKKS